MVQVGTVMVIGLGSGNSANVSFSFADIESAMIRGHFHINFTIQALDSSQQLEL
jgi:hypothetical protein